MIPYIVPLLYEDKPKNEMTLNISIKIDPPPQFDHGLYFRYISLPWKSDV